jgi:hypothetical protein
LKRITPILITLLLAISTSAQERPIVDLRGQWKFNIGDKPFWKDENFDDEEWQNIFTPSTWENEGFSGYDGFAWYRKTFDFPSNQQDKYLILDLGYIDDTDEVYLNGRLIGLGGSMPPNFRTAYNSRRKYTIPSNLLRDRGNVIAVRVYDQTLEGGIINGRIGIYEHKGLPNFVLPLAGVWKFKEGDNINWQEPDYEDDSWTNTILPGSWKGYKDHSFTKFWGGEESFAWYRKQFVIPEHMENCNDLVVILGKIDDFDKTYLNGQLIGETNDNKPFGESHSYEQMRIYPLPTQCINTYGVNTLAIRVKDIGGEAGVYQGPIIICTEEDIQKVLRAF